jgi:hypothetical protein
MALFPVLTADGSTILTTEGFAAVVSVTPVTPAGPGNVLITDFVITTAAILDGTTGAYLDTAELVPTDYGEILPSGIIGLYDGDNTNAFVVYAADYSLIASVTIGAPMSLTNAAISSDRSHTFYAAYCNGSAAAVVSTISDAGVVGGTTWTLPNTSKSLMAAAPNAAGTILYYTSLTTGGGGTGSVVYRYDLVNSIAISNLVAALTNYNSVKDLLVLDDDTILVGYHSATNGQQEKIVHYDTSGGVLNTYTFGLRSAVSLNRFNRAGSDETLIAWIQNNPASQPVTFYYVTVADGTVTGSFPATEAGSQGNPALEEISNSCPVLITAGETPVVGTTFPIRRLRRFAL